MVLRMTGAGWLAAMMRVEREEGEAFDDAWLLFGPSDPAVVERRASENDPGGTSRKNPLS